MRAGPHLLLVAPLLLLAACARPPEQRPQSHKIPREEPRVLAVPTVRFVVRTNPVAGTLHVTGGFNGWQPDASAFAFERTVETTAGVVWTLELERELLGPAPIEFKFTRGSWESVETDGAFADVPNRSISAEALAGWPDQALLVLDFRVSGFRDLRAEPLPRAPAGRRATLDTFELASVPLANARTIRVWLPPGYDAPENSDARYPVLYLQDGQNLFDATSSFRGLEWQVDETAARLIAEQRIAPLVVVGIDHAGLARAPEYNPPEVLFPGGPGRADRYVEFLERELLPAVEARYRVARDGRGRALGGSSFGANAALYAAMRAPHLFGALLLESPAIGYQDGALLALAQAHTGWPARVAIGAGTMETDDAERSAAWLADVRALERVFTDAGLGPERLVVTIEEGARHDEAAWARRLPAALEFLFPPDGE